MKKWVIVSLVISCLIFMITFSGCANNQEQKNMQVSTQAQGVSAEITQSVPTTSETREINNSNQIPVLPELLYAKTSDSFKFTKDPIISLEDSKTYRIEVNVNQNTPSIPPSVAVLKLYDSEKKAIPLFVYKYWNVKNDESTFSLNSFDDKTGTWASIINPDGDILNYYITKPGNPPAYYYSVEYRDLTDRPIGSGDKPFADAAELCFTETPVITNLSTHLAFVTCMQKTPQPTSACAKKFRADVLKYTNDDDTTSGFRRETHNAQVFRLAFYTNESYNKEKGVFEPCG